MSQCAFRARTFIRSSKIISDPRPCISELHFPRRNVYFNNNIIFIYTRESMNFHTFHPVQFKICDVKSIKNAFQALFTNFSWFLWVTRISEITYIKRELSVSTCTTVLPYKIILNDYYDNIYISEYQYINILTERLSLKQ